MNFGSIPWNPCCVDGRRSFYGHGRLADCTRSWAETKRFHTFFAWIICSLTGRTETSCVVLSTPVYTNVIRLEQNVHGIKNDQRVAKLTSEYIDSSPSSWRRIVLDSFMSIVVLRSSSLCDELESESASKSRPVVVDVMSPRSRASCSAVNGCRDPRMNKVNCYFQTIQNGRSSYSL